MDHASDQRIGDGDRALALDRLGQYFADGYLDVAEFEERTGEAAVARTRKEIAALFADLPAQSAASGDVVATGPAPDMRAQRELDEVMDVPDRILVMYEGEIVGELDPKNTTQEELGLYMAGAKRDEVKS